MAFDSHPNFAVSLVATAPSPATSGTTLTVTAGEGSRFAATPFNAVICPRTAVPTPANAEVVRVTNRSGDVLTIARAQESSAPRSVQEGDRIFAAVTSKVLTDIEGFGHAQIAGFSSWLPTGAIAETAPARVAGNSSAAVTSGTLYLAGGVVIPGGQAASSITCVCAVTGVNLTHQWFCLIDPADLSVLATTVDDAATAWAQGKKTLALATAIGGATPGGSYTPSVDKAVYVGLCVTFSGGGSFSFAGNSRGTTLAGIAPIISATSSTALTTPASLGATAGALTGFTTPPYAYIS